MKVSIIIPVYNVERYLNECIESVLSQNCTDLEIILINDGSEDGSQKVCEKYARENSNIVLINKENTGLSDTRNLGIKYATGEYIIFLDSDDYWSKSFLKEAINIIKTNRNIDLLFFKVVKFYEDSNKIINEELIIKNEELIGKKGEDALLYILERNKYFEWYSCRFLVKRELLLSNGLFFKKNRNYEDALWSPMVFLKAKCVYFLDKEIYNYRLNREGQITSRVSKKNIVDSIYVAEYWYKKINELQVSTELRNIMLNNLCIRYFYAIWFNYNLDLEEQNYIIYKLKENKQILKYTNGPRERLTTILVQILGFNTASKIYGYLIKSKKSIKRIKNNIKKLREEKKS